MDILSLSFSFSLAIWCMISYNEGSADAWDYVRKITFHRNGIDLENIYNKMPYLKERTTKGELIFSWGLRFGIYLALFAFKMNCIYSFGQFSSIEKTLLIASVALLPVMVFPFFYYSGYCVKIHAYDHSLAPRRWRDNLENDGGALISFKLRTSFLIFGVLTLISQMFIIFNFHEICS